MNRIVINKQDVKENDLLVIEEPHIVDHINNILKLKSEDSLKICLLNSALATGEIKDMTSSKITVKIKALSSGLHSDVHLQVGLCRPPTIKKVLEHGTSLGVNKFEFFKANLSEKSYLDSKVFERKEQYLHLGLAQSGTYFNLPEVYTSLEFSLSKNKQKFFLSFNTDQNLSDYDINYNDPITFAIGPERGWTANEEQVLKENDYLPIKIAESILRVEIATFVLLGQYHLLKN